jgi:hypothetical protein
MGEENVGALRIVMCPSQMEGADNAGKNAKEDA